DWPRWLWLPILHGIVLNVRPKKSARLYQNIWDQGSPLFNIMIKQADQIEASLKDRGQQGIHIAVGMRYGSPSIAAGLNRLRQQGVRRIVVLPLFPQYSSTTSASIYDAVFDELKTWDWIPEVRLVNDYHDHPRYIEALADSISETWDGQAPPEKLLFSFHGVPKRYLDHGDPYRRQCSRTASLVAERLGLNDEGWQLAFQSRFGPEEWLQPYTDKTLEQWGRRELNHVQVVCPGFSADCLETLDEINREARHIFEEAGGKTFDYIPALNNRSDHIDTLVDVILAHAGEGNDNSAERNLVQNGQHLEKGIRVQ
ncbi:MAG: ferrochelatase, partial [Anaerolineae bacterium]|nr:ferrochelatase [Anaerolineae bacterium]